MIPAHIEKAFQEYMEKRGEELDEANARAVNLERKRAYAAALRNDFLSLTGVSDRELRLNNSPGMQITLENRNSAWFRHHPPREGVLDEALSDKLHEVSSYAWNEYEKLETGLDKEARALTPLRGGSLWHDDLLPHLHRLMRERGFPLRYQDTLDRWVAEYNDRQMTQSTYELLATSSVEEIYERMKTEKEN